jgi:hypothetical protein
MIGVSPAADQTPCAPAKTTLPDAYVTVPNVSGPSA